MIITKFTNEAGNRIKIKIQKNRDIGIDEEVKIEGVKININIPMIKMNVVDSEITLVEAKQLYESLGKYLSSKKSKEIQRNPKY
jgi:hypothetical protein